MNGEQDAALFHASFVALRFILRYAHSHEGSDYTANRAAGARASESSNDRTGGDKRSNAGDRKSTYSCQPAQCSTRDRSCACAGGCAFWRLRVFLVGKVLSAFVLRE